jgi:Flp pilus assembly protein TadD
LSRQEATVDEAAAHLRSAIALNPNFPEAYHTLAGLYVKLGRVAEAIPLYQKAIVLRPDYPQARRNLAVAERLERAREKSYP